MAFKERLQKSIDQGLKTSRDLFSKARDKAKDLGEIGVLRFEIKQLENQAEMLTAKLGTSVYEILSSEDRKSVSVNTPEVKEMLAAIQKVHREIDEKEAELKKFE